MVSVFWSENGLEMSAAITFVAGNWVVFADSLKIFLFFFQEGFYIIKFHRTKLYRNYLFFVVCFTLRRKFKLQWSVCRSKFLSNFKVRFNVYVSYRSKPKRKLWNKIIKIIMPIEIRYIKHQQGYGNS